MQDSSIKPSDAADDGLAPSTPVSWPHMLRVWAYIGLNSFGGPTGQIAVMHKVLVDQKRWISEERFLHALNYCMLLPGPEATQLATYVGWLMHRTLGGIIAGVLFVAPGFISILVLSIMYTEFGDVSAVQSILFGLKAAVLAIILEALIRIGKRVLRNGVMYAVAAASFIAIFVFEVPFPAIVISAGILGYLGDRFRPELFEVIRFKSAKSPSDATQHYVTDVIDAAHTRPSLGRSLRVLAVWLPLWLIPVIALHVSLGPTNVFAAESWFFSKAAVVTFGGAYAVLAYLAQQAVEVYHWLEPGEMLTGLGMAESTPGPLIQVVQFVGYMGAYRDPGPLHPIAAGALASVLATWVTFVPCFLWIFLGAPYMEYVRNRKSLTAALSTITASIVGVVLNLAVWFALHTLFADVSEHRWLAMRLILPVWTPIDWPALVIAVASGFCLFKLHWGVLRVLAVAVTLSLAWSLVDQPL